MQPGRAGHEPDHGAEQQRERSASLGTMAAGLAHELNNPAPRPRARPPRSWPKRSRCVSASIGRFVEAGVEREEAERARRPAARGARAAPATAEPLDALDAADAEDAMLERLEGLGVAEPWRLAEPLAAAGVDAAWLERVASAPGPATDAAVAWVAATLTARGLAAELAGLDRAHVHARRAVKSYSYMDRGELVEVDLHEGLETTLTVLGHKLKHTTIAVAPRLRPRRCRRSWCRGSELNQVWTNLLDNAIDALGDAGTITITHPARRRPRGRSTSPTTARASRPRSASASSTPSSPPRTSARGRGSAWPPPGASWSTATTAR